MALVLADRVRETSTSTGTSTISLGGAYTGFQTFSATVGNGNTTYYTIANVVSGEWEVGIGAYTSAGNTLSRDTVLASSNAGSLVNFSSGSKDVFITQPAERALYLNGSTITTKGATFTANGVPYASSTSELTTGSGLTFNGTTLTATGLSGPLNGTVGATTANTGAFTTLTTSSTVTHNGGTANGVAYLNSSKVLTTGSALTFDGTNFGGGVNVLVSDNKAIGFGSNAYWLGNSASGFIAGYINSSEQMRLTSTGLGIGTSSPAYPLDVVASSGSFGISLRGRSSDNIGTLGFFTNNGATNDVQLQMRPSDNEFRILVAGARSQTFYTNGSERMRLDSAGNLGLGVTPSAWSGFKVFEVASAGSALWSSGVTDIRMSANMYYNGNYRYAGTGAASRYEQSSGIHAWYNAPSGTAGNAISFTQAMTLDASGNLLVGTTSATAGAASTFQISASATSTAAFVCTHASSPNGIIISYANAAPNNTANEFWYCKDSGAAPRASMRSNGGLANYSANNVNLSDERTKTDIVDAGNYLAKICAIPVRTFKYKDQTDDLLNLGVIAQEVEAIAPELVDVSGFGETPEDGVPFKAIYKTDLQFALMKCIQEHQALITSLTARLDAANL